MMVAWGCFVLYMYEVVFGRSDLDNRPDKGTLKDEDFDYVDLIAKREEQAVLKKAKDEKQIEDLLRSRQWEPSYHECRGQDRDKEVFPIDKDDAGREETQG
jgi:hypothetical protein